MPAAQARVRAAGPPGPAGAGSGGPGLDRDPRAQLKSRAEFCALQQVLSPTRSQLRNLLNLMASVTVTVTPGVPTTLHRGQIRRNCCPGRAAITKDVRHRRDFQSGKSLSPFCCLCLPAPSQAQSGSAGRTAGTVRAGPDDSEPWPVGFGGWPSTTIKSGYPPPSSHCGCTSAHLDYAGRTQ